MNELPPSNPQIDEILAKAKTGSELVELLHQYNIDLANKAWGGEAVLQPPSAPAQPQPSYGGTDQFFEVLYPRGNDRLEISAATQQEFDRKKAAILAAYGK